MRSMVATEENSADSARRAHSRRVAPSVPGTGFGSPIPIFIHSLLESLLGYRKQRTQARKIPLLSSVCTLRVLGGEKNELVLDEGALARWFVVAPAQKTRRVAEAIGHHPVERNLAHERRLQRHPRPVFAARPPARRAGDAAAGEARSALERAQHLEQLPFLLGLERRRVPNVVQVPSIVVQAQQQRADSIAALRVAVAADDTFDGALAFDFHHGPAARFVDAVALLGYDAVEALRVVVRKPL